MNIAFPFKFDGRGRTAVAGYEDHVRQMIEQLLFTMPLERVNRPDFGSGVGQLVFAPNSLELQATLQHTMKAALQRYLGDIIEVMELEVDGVDSTLNIILQYRLVAEGSVVRAQLQGSL